MAGHFAKLSPELENHLATAPTSKLLSLVKDFPTDPGGVSVLAKRGNQLRVRAAAFKWGEKGTRVNSISPGVISTPMGTAMLSGPSGVYVQAMVGLSGCRRFGTPDDIAGVAAFLTSQDASYITGNYVLVDGGTVSGQAWRSTEAKT